MLRFVVRRLLLLIPILFGVSVVVFIGIRNLPGGPAQALLGQRATTETVKAINEQYGLDKPIWEQYGRYMKTVLSGDLGTSVTTRQTVTSEIGQRFPATVELTLAAMTFALLFGIPLGFLAAKRHGGV